MAANNQRYSRRSDTTYHNQQYQQQMRGHMGQQGAAMPMQGFPYSQMPPGYQFQQFHQQQMLMDGRTVGPVYNQFGGMPNMHGVQFMPYNPQMQAYQQQYMPQQMMQQHQQHQQMTQHSAHSSPTPPIHQQQPQQAPPPQPPPQQQPPPSQQPPQQIQQPTPHQPKPKSKGIVIKDPNSNKEVDLATLAAQPTSAPATEQTDTIQNKERRNTFKEQVHQQVHKGAAGAPHPAPHGAATGAKLEQRAPTPVEIKKPAVTTPSPAKPAVTTPSPAKPAVTTPSPAKPAVTTPSPAKPAVTQEQPAKSITPKSILPRTNSQSDDKTPEKQGVEMSVQTTPSLKKLSQTTPVGKVPAQPTFTSPSKVEDTTKKEAEVPAKKEERVKSDLSSIASIGDKKLDGEAIIIDNSSRKEAVKEEKKEEVKVKPAEEVKEKPVEEPKVKPVEETQVNGVVEKAAERLTIEIPNGEEITPAEDVPSSEESSECKDQFETPPATPSEVRPEIPAEPPAKPAEPVKPVEPVKPAEPVVAAEVAPVHAEPAKEEVKKESTKTEAPIPAKIEIDSKELEEGEIVEEEETTPTGPFRYSREEMVALREAQDKILPGVPKFDCIMDRPILKAEPTRPRPNNQFVPAWEQSGSRNKSRDHRNRSMDKNHSSMMMKPRIIEHTLAPVVTRKKSSNAWLSKREDGTKKDPTKVSENKVLRGNIVAILNKITPQNFKELSVQILQLKIDNKDKLEIAVEIIFEKAVLEPAFSQTYANLCKIMGSIKFPEEQNAKVSPFRKTLLNRCQKEFFREKSDEDKLTKEMEELQAKTDMAENEKQNQLEELMYQRSKLKKKMLGNINFIGELFNLGMLSSKIIISQCIGNLLAKKEEGKLDDEVVECLAKLFSTVGLKLENECDDELKKRAFEKSFSDFKELGSNSNYAYRIRFMIQDVVELRDNNWVPRRVEAKPQRIEDIHREHAKEEQQKKMEAAVAASSRKSKSRADSRDERGRGSRDGRMDKHEYNAPPKRVSTNIDMSKLSGANQKVDSGNLILGPSRHQWGRGSGTGSGTNSPLSGSKEDLTSSNRFDMLNKKPSLAVPGRTSSAPAPRKMMDRDRERSSAIAHAQAIGRGKPGGRRTPSQSPVRSSPEKFDLLSDEDIKKKTKSILMEYFDIEEIEEACACIKEEMQLVKKHHVFIQESIDIVMEAKPKCLRLLGELFPALFEEDPPLMTADGLLTGFQPGFEVAQDLAIDVPAIYANFGKLLGPTFAKGHLTFKVIKGALGPLRESDKAGLVMCEIIKSALDVLDDKGSMEIQQRWGKDQMSWSDLCNDPSSLIQKYKLDFLSTTSEPKESVSDIGIDIKASLMNYFENSDSPQNDVFSYIDRTVPEKAQKEAPFIKELMNVACTFCIEADAKSVGQFEISETNFGTVTPILKKYLQSGKDNSNLELHALDAAQLLIHGMSHPRDLAYALFGKLEEEEIITETGFRHWRENGTEQQGHGVMRQNLKSFFEELSQDSADDSETGS